LASVLSPEVRSALRDPGDFESVVLTLQLSEVELQRAHFGLSLFRFKPKSRAFYREPLHLSRLVTPSASQALLLPLEGQRCVLPPSREVHQRDALVSDLNLLAPLQALVLAVVVLEGELAVLLLRAKLKPVLLRV